MNPLSSARRSILPALAASVRMFGGFALFATAATVIPMEAAIATTALPTLVTEPGLAFDARSERNGPGPLYYARLLPLDSSLDQGQWDEPQPGQARWRLLVQSPGAKSISLDIRHFGGAPDAHLYLRNPRTDMTQGPYTIDDVNPDGSMSTAMVFGEQAIVEVLLPAAQRDQLALEIGGVMHGDRDLRKIQENFGDSGACNIDVACAQGDPWREQIRSVVGLTFRVGSNGAFCTGNLTNNTRQDGTPLVLTAHHCLLRQGNAGSVVAYWNFEREACGAGEPRDLTESDNGAVLLSTHSASDHTLIRLEDRPPASADAFYTGWDATGDPVTDGASIHHPSGDVKKISLFNEALRKDRVSISGQTVDAWVVRWSQGTTEQGSSGAGIWNSERHMVGVLFGGEASCDDQDASDVYGRMEVAWLGGRTRDSQLCIHLAADGADTRQLDGLEQENASQSAGGDPEAALANCEVMDGNSGGNGGDGGGSGGGTWWAPALLLAGLWRRRVWLRNGHTSTSA